MWDVRTMMQKVLAAGDRTWDSDGVPTHLTAKPGVIPRGTILQTGIPQGVVYRAPDTRQRFLGFMEWAGSFGTLGELAGRDCGPGHVRPEPRQGFLARLALRGGRSGSRSSGDGVGICLTFGSAASSVRRRIGVGRCWRHSKVQR
ncbi:hypothetical protein GCM10007977_088250 [Dactylosporangium sucinum]|uniref:Uncharacterized protein n=1 Tax=Dactylosporangium sucinum TaxID=1424081 RepID=A0A917X5P4_9ACTN|nr:hypothetical protein GCM10007977_088250 [Dactylosporangium sucinum]